LTATELEFTRRRAMREAPLTDRQGIVKDLVVWTNVAPAMTQLLLRRFPMRNSRMLLKLSTTILLFGLLVTAPLSVALAEPIQGPKGQACKSTGTTTVDGKEEGTGKKLKCTADYCKYDECVFSGTTKTCQEYTHYVNVRDCKAAALIHRPENIRPDLPATIYEPPAPVPPRRGERLPVAPGLKQP
jgi:hypothetical protein